MHIAGEIAELDGEICVLTSLVQPRIVSLEALNNDEELVYSAICFCSDACAIDLARSVSMMAQRLRAIDFGAECTVSGRKESSNSAASAHRRRWNRTFGNGHW